MSNQIHIVCICKNEIDIIQEFIDHHVFIADRITVIDNGSTDGTVEYLMNNNNIELISNTSHFSMKIKMMKSVISRSKSDIILPLDVDEFIFLDTDNIKSKNPSDVKKYLQNLDLSYRGFKIKKIYNYIPNNPNYYSIEKDFWRSKKFILNRKEFYGACPGYHKIYYKIYCINNNTGPVFETELSYIHKHYRSFDSWFRSAKQKMTSRIGEKWNDVDTLKNYTGYSNHTAKELYSYFTTGNWMLNLEPSIKIEL
jgi:hypothetical protein